MTQTLLSSIQHEALSPLGSGLESWKALALKASDSSHGVRQLASLFNQIKGY
jgi:hypothetical protein